jgi:hypothetical protein
MSHNLGKGSIPKEEASLGKRLAFLKLEEEVSGVEDVDNCLDQDKAKDKDDRISFGHDLLQIR